MTQTALTRRALCVALSVCLLPVAALAQDRGTKEEAKAMMEAALAHVKKVGAEQAFKDFSTDKATWTKKDLYPFAEDFTGKMLAHGANDKLIGRDMTNMKDSTGKLFNQEMVAVAKKGEGWVDYEWVDPLTKKIAGKSAYIKAVPGAELFIGVGVYR